MRIRNALLAVCTAFFAATASAQNCSTLAVSGGSPGSQLTIAVSGAPANTPTIVLLSQSTGSTVIPTPFGTLSLGLASPFSPLPLGTTDANGDASISFQVPAQAAMCVMLYGQALSIEFDITVVPPTLSFCTSNVAPIALGPCN